MAQNTKSKIKDGWHTICGYEVLVENGYIMRGVSSTDWNQVATYVYRACKPSGWSSTGPITVDAFRAGVRRGTIIME